jgi:putative NADH-flavin reductase
MKLFSVASALFFGSASAFVSRISTINPHSAATTHLQATIAVFGASGLTSRECIYQALKDGDTVIGLTRNASNVKVPKGSGGSDGDQPLKDPNLTVIAGDVTKAADVAKVFENDIDGVIVALGGKTSDGKFDVTSVFCHFRFILLHAPL